MMVLADRAIALILPLPTGAFGLAPSAWEKLCDTYGIHDVSGA